MKKVMIVVVLVIAVGAVLALKSKQSETEKVSDSAVVTSDHNATNQTLTTANKAIEKTLPKLLDLGAGKCVPCKMMTPILDEMEKNFAGQLNIEFIDVWKDKSAGDKYGIRMIPTQIFFDTDGKELFRHEGFFAREDILAKWNELGYNFIATNQ